MSEIGAGLIPLVLILLAAYVAQAGVERWLRHRRGRDGEGEP